jgi:hypothetical protein
LDKGASPRLRTPKLIRGKLNLPARFAATAAPAAGPPPTAAAAGASAAATAAAAEAVAATGAAARAALGLGPRFIDIQRAAIHRESIERGNSLIRLSFVFHLNECETAGTAGVAIRHDSGAIHDTVPCKQATHCLFGNVEIQVADEDVLHSKILLFKFESKGSSERKHKAVRSGYTRAGFAKAYQTRLDYIMAYRATANGFRFKTWEK